jgi:hypothetical protein
VPLLFEVKTQQQPLERHRQVERGLAWRRWRGQVSGSDDDTSRPSLCRLSPPRRTDQLRGLAVFPLR